MAHRRIVLFEQDSVGNKDWFLSTPYYPGDAFHGKLRRLLRYINERKKSVHKILRSEHGWIGEIATTIVWEINDQPVSFECFYRSQIQSKYKPK